MNRTFDMLQLAQLLGQVITSFDSLLQESETTAEFSEAAQTYLQESAASLPEAVRTIYSSQSRHIFALYQARLLQRDEQQATAEVVEALQQVRTQLHGVMVEGLALHDGPYLDGLVAIYNAVLEGLQELNALDANAANDARQQMAAEAAARTLDHELEQTPTPLLQCLMWLKNGMALPPLWLANRWQREVHS